MVASPPGPFAQKINAWLHREPIATIAHGIYWTIFLTVAAPVAVVYLQIETAIKLILLFFRDREFCKPDRFKDQELAVVITGCDSGFGKEIALWAADAGFCVFAGCLDEGSFDQLDMPNIVPMKMDVTSDKEVEAVAKKVSEWLTEGDEGLSARKRSLHALINNAGVGIGGEVDWLKLSEFQMSIDGMSVLGIVAHWPCCKFGYAVTQCCMF